MKTGEWVILLAVVIGVLLMLFRSLGRRPSGEGPPDVAQNRIHRLVTESSEPQETSEVGEGDELAPDPQLNFDDVEDKKTVRKWADKARTVEPDFSAADFLACATAAFYQITRAFAKGDRKTLEYLVDKKTIGVFWEALRTRGTEGTTVLLDDLEVKEANLEAIEIKSKHLYGVVKFVSLQHWVYLDAKGNQITGEQETSPSEGAVQMKDRWTFCRRIGDKDPKWLLVALESLDEES